MCACSKAPFSNFPNKISAIWLGVLPLDTSTLPTPFGILGGMSHQENCTTGCNSHLPNELVEDHQLLFKDRPRNMLRIGLRCIRECNLVIGFTKSGGLSDSCPCYLKYASRVSYHR